MEVIVGRTYQYFKGNKYKVIAIAYDCEDETKKIVYQALYGDGKIWVRDYDEFISKVDKEKYPDCLLENRFTLID